jgi:hypothetical protein
MILAHSLLTPSSLSSSLTFSCLKQSTVGAVQKMSVNVIGLGHIEELEERVTFQGRRSLYTPCLVRSLEDL